MNAHRKPSPATPDATLRARAEALRSATTRQHPADALGTSLESARIYADQFDFGSLSIKDMARLYEIAGQADEFWGLIGEMSLCGVAGPSGFTERTQLGRFVELEEHRMAFLRDRCAAMIAQRVPADEAERDEILCVRVAHQMRCNGRIDPVDAPGLLIEALKAWG